VLNVNVAHIKHQTDIVNLCKIFAFLILLPKQDGSGVELISCTLNISE